MKKKTKQYIVITENNFCKYRQNLTAGINNKNC